MGRTESSAPTNVYRGSARDVEDAVSYDAAMKRRAQRPFSQPVGLLW